MLSDNNNDDEDKHPCDNIEFEDALGVVVEILVLCEITQKVLSHDVVFFIIEIAL